MIRSAYDSPIISMIVSNMYKTDNIVAFLDNQLKDAVHLRNTDLEETFRFEWPVNDVKAQLY